jgi:hypothetical protein
MTLPGRQRRSTVTHSAWICWRALTPQLQVCLHHQTKYCVAIDRSWKVLGPSTRPLLDLVSTSCRVKVTVPLTTSPKFYHVILESAATLALRYPSLYGAAFLLDSHNDLNKRKKYIVSLILRLSTSAELSWTEFDGRCCSCPPFRRRWEMRLVTCPSDDSVKSSKLSPWAN